MAMKNHDNDGAFSKAPPDPWHDRNDRLEFPRWTGPDRETPDIENVTSDLVKQALKWYAMEDYIYSRVFVILYERYPKARLDDLSRRAFETTKIALDEWRSNHDRENKGATKWKPNDSPTSSSS